MDYIRLWPLPFQHPWFEDWWERYGSTGTTGFIERNGWFWKPPFEYPLRAVLLIVEVFTFLGNFLSDHLSEYPVSS
jgi:hypothetical protein